MYNNVQKTATTEPSGLQPSRVQNPKARGIFQGRVVSPGTPSKKKKVKACPQSSIKNEPSQSIIPGRASNSMPVMPTYLRELQTNGYDQLYDHLMEMRSCPTRNARSTKIKRMTFSSWSQIVLQTREAILQKVKASIPDQFTNMILLLGGSGKGKSTALCFLNGDEMFLNKDSLYESRNDNAQIIGHSSFSCTFLPNIRTIDSGRVIVDFPGFGDTNGELVSLGMEFALKALVQKYDPKILIFEAIVGEDRNDASAQLGLRLDRLLGNKRECCILALTKYSCNADYRELTIIEEQQKKELQSLLDRPSQEEIALMSKIELYNELIQENPSFLAKKQQLEDELSLKQQVRLSRSHQALPETNHKTLLRQRIQTKEAEILSEIELQYYIRFCDLERAESLTNCLATLSEIPVSAAQVSPNCLDAKVGQLLKEGFDNDLRSKLEPEQSNYHFNDIKSFKQSVETSSLIGTITQQSYPEIGHFLHLPEMDPLIVREYDKQIVRDCLNSYETKIILESKISSLLSKEKELSKYKEGQELVKKLVSLRNYIMGLRGVITDNPKVATEEWKNIEEKEKKVHEAYVSVQKKLTLPTWAVVALCIPVGVPFGIYKLVEHLQLSKASQERHDKLAPLQKDRINYIMQCSKEIDQDLANLTGLGEIRTFIEKQDVINKIFHSHKIFKQLTNIMSLIEKIRSQYEKEDFWNARVDFLAGKLVGSEEFSKETVISIVAFLFDSSVLDPKSLNSSIFNSAPLVEFRQKNIVELPERMGLTMTIPLTRVLLGAAILRKYSLDSDCQSNRCEEPMIVQSSSA